MLKLDYTVTRKFEELAEKAKKVSSSQLINDIAATVDSKLFQDWANSALSLLQQIFGEESAYYRNFQSIYAKIINITYKENFDNCRAIVQSAREEYEAGGLTEVRLFLDHAVLEYLGGRTSEFLKRGDNHTACILASVLLEQVLMLICGNKGIATGSTDEMNEALYQAKAYQVGTYQRIKDWCYMKADFLAGQGERYRTADVDEMLRGVQRFIAKEIG
ncbi:hypothetical protein [Geomonas anaerohicana]|uniref:Uncharacterized protein n=1 Tax=Geomonas anaerohicana TaxID=2798583 RepID=A0ABS0Y9Y2_9BACT|nr:hypothetical protein [Geomonas anaerohicana]MBJ6749094.1 hypothetical protein [Geomonas anaerohicana]